MAGIFWYGIPYNLRMYRLSTALASATCTWAEVAVLADLPSPAPAGVIRFVRGSGEVGGIQTRAGKRVFLASDDRTMMIALVEQSRIRMAFYEKGDVSLLLALEDWAGVLSAPQIGFRLEATRSTILSASERLVTRGFSVSNVS